MRFSHPEALWLLVVLIPVLALSWPRLKGITKPRKILAFTLRTCVFISIVLALAGLYREHGVQGLCTVFVLDASESITSTERKRAERFIADALAKSGPNDYSALVLFGTDAAIDLAPGIHPSIGMLSTQVVGNASDLATGLRLASAVFPDRRARRIVMLTDGNETQGDAAAAAEALAASGIQVDTVHLGSNKDQAEVSMLSLDIPVEAQLNQPIRVRAVLDSNTQTEGTLMLERDGQIIAQQRVALKPGKNSVVLTDTLPTTGFHRYRATFEANDDTDVRNNVGAAYVAVRGMPKTLVVSSQPTKSVLGNALRRQGMEVVAGGPGLMPRNLSEAQAYDAIIFDDLNAADILPTDMNLVKSSIQDAGLGFMMVGGENSYLPGGYYGTPIAEALPVSLDISQRKSIPSTSILIVVDASGSMGATEDGHQKIRLAAMGAERIVQMMPPYNRVGVAGSSDSIDYISPMSELSDKSRVINQIQKLNANTSGIFACMSLEFALKELSKETSKVRHLILLGDGSDVDADGDYVALAEKFAQQKITISTVAIGDGPDVPILKMIASKGKGRFFLADSAGKLPAIFTQDASIVARAAIEEGVFRPKVMLGEEILDGIPSQSIPPLYGYCLSEARPLARTSMKTHKDDPLLASWQFGLGRTVAFTSDAQARWGAEWVAWPRYSQFFSQAVRTIVRRPTQNDYEVQVRNEGGKAKITVLATDPLGQPLNSMSASIRAGGPGGSSEEVTVRQVGPGKYEGSFEAKELGTYVVSIGEKSAGNGANVQSAGLNIAYPPEYQRFRTNSPLLQDIERITGGKQLKEPREAWRTRVDEARTSFDLWPFLLLLSALLLPLDIAVRRIALPISELLKFRPTSTKTAQPNLAVQSLRAAKQTTANRSRPKEPVQLGTLQPPETEVEPEPTAAEAPSSFSVGARLLDKKRNRSDDPLDESR